MYKVEGGPWVCDRCDYGAGDTALFEALEEAKESEEE